MATPSTPDSDGLLDPADQVAILALYQEYNRAIDRGDAVAWASTWTATGAFEHPARTYQGRTELEAFVRDRAAAAVTAPVVDTEHWITDIELTKDAVGVAGACRLLVSGRSREAGTAIVVTTGDYSDLVVRTDSGWRFLRRSLRVNG